MSRRGGNRLAVLLMTGVLLGDLWSWGSRWLEAVLSPWEPETQADCDHGSMIDPDGQPTADHGLMIDPNG